MAVAESLAFGGICLRHFQCDCHIIRPIFIVMLLLSDSINWFSIDAQVSINPFTTILKIHEINVLYFYMQIRKNSFFFNCINVNMGKYIPNEVCII